MKFTSGQLAKAKNAKTADELMRLADDEGIALSRADAEKYLAFLAGGDTELPEDTLDEIAGGKNDYVRPAGVTMGRAPDGAAMCPYCGGPLEYPYSQRDPNGDKYDYVWCRGCSSGFRHYFKGDTWTVEG